MKTNKITIEKTDKKAKLVTLIAIALIVLGSVMLLCGVTLEDALITVIGLLIILLGIVSKLMSRLLAWWSNG